MGSRINHKGEFMAKRAKSVSRRSFVGLVTGAATAAAFSAPVSARLGEAESDKAATNPGGNQVTDADAGSNRDCAGNGRGTRNGYTDADSGSSADPAGRGRSGITDSDSGSTADRGGHGRGRGSCAG